MHSNEFCNDYFSPVYFGFYMCAIASYMNMSIENGIDFICNFIENLQQCKIECTPTWLFEILIQHHQKHAYRQWVWTVPFFRMLYDSIEIYSVQCLIDNDKEMPEILFCWEILSSNFARTFFFSSFLLQQILHSNTLTYSRKRFIHKT